LAVGRDVGSEVTGSAVGLEVGFEVGRKLGLRVTGCADAGGATDVAGGEAVVDTASDVWGVAAIVVVVESCAGPTSSGSVTSKEGAAVGCTN